jgi:hypothetical protein
MRRILTTIAVLGTCTAAFADEQGEAFVHCANDQASRNTTASNETDALGFAAMACAKQNPEGARQWCQAYIRKPGNLLDMLSDQNNVVATVMCPQVASKEELAQWAEANSKAKQDAEDAFCNAHPDAGLCVQRKALQDRKELCKDAPPGTARLRCEAGMSGPDGKLY